MTGYAKGTNVRNMIAVCECGQPLVPTMMIDRAEYFCMGCGKSFGMMDTERCEETPELAARQDELRAKFHAVTASCIPYGARKHGCDKCSDGHHLQHASDDERAASARAYETLHALRHNTLLEPRHE